MTAYYTYVLKSERFEKTYTGSTKDLQQRLLEHNQGRVKSLKPYLPFKIVYFEEFGTLASARRKERYFKSTSGRRDLKKFLTVS